MLLPLLEMHFRLLLRRRGRRRSFKEGRGRVIIKEALQARRRAWCVSQVSSSREAWRLTHLGSQVGLVGLIEEPGVHQELLLLLERLLSGIEEHLLGTKGTLLDRLLMCPQR